MGLGFRVQGFGIICLGFRVQGFGIMGGFSWGSSYLTP